jgi:hypothetical protein
MYLAINFYIRTVMSGDAAADFAAISSLCEEPVDRDNERNGESTIKTKNL